jgi:hypothetical protein
MASYNAVRWLLTTLVEASKLNGKISPVLFKEYRPAGQELRQCERASQTKNCPEKFLYLKTGLYLCPEISESRYNF